MADGTTGKPASKDDPRGRWHRIGSLREPEVKAKVFRTYGLVVELVEPYCMVCDDGAEWCPVVIRDQALHLTDFYRRKHPTVPGNNIVILSGEDGCCMRYSE